MATIREFVADPHAFYESRAENPSLLWPGLVVLANALSATALILFLFSIFSGVFSAGAKKALTYAISGQTVTAPRELVFGAVIAFGMYFAIWLVVTGFISLVGWYYDADGSTRSTFALVGWSLLPVLVGNVASTLLLLWLLSGAPALGTESAVAEWVVTNVAENPAHRAVRFVRPFLTVWTVYLWVLAGMYGRDLTRRQSLLAIAVPGLVALVNALGTYYFMFA